MGWGVGMDGSECGGLSWCGGGFNVGVEVGERGCVGGVGLGGDRGGGHTSKKGGVQMGAPAWVGLLFGSSFLATSKQNV